MQYATQFRNTEKISNQIISKPQNTSKKNGKNDIGKKGCIDMILIDILLLDKTSAQTSIWDFHKKGNQNIKHMKNPKIVWQQMSRGPHQKKNSSKNYNNL